MLQTNHNPKQFNYFDYKKMIKHLQQKPLVSIQQIELNRIDCLNRLPNKYEIQFIKRLMCEQQIEGVQ